MSTSSLQNTPVEILALICEYVGLSHRPSLLSFALASKSCHSIAKRFFFHTIRFSAIDQDRFEEDVQECIDILKENAAFSYIRTLLITDPGWDENDAPGELATTYNRNTSSWSFGLPLSLSEIVDGDKDRLQGLECYSAIVPNEPPDEFLDDDDDDGPLTDAAWKPLARLVQMLQGLGDVLYASLDRFPPCLLRALLQHHPHCRLHVFTFTLNSLRLPETDPDELALMTAPCLYSIWMWYYDTDGFDQDGEPAYHAEAIDSMVRTLAPNLKEVHLFQERGSPYDFDDNSLPDRPPWKGFTNVGANLTCMPAQLKSLELGLDILSTDLRIARDREAVDSWTANKLSSLRTLRLSRVVGHEALGSLIRANSFSCLTTLLFNCEEEYGRAYYDDVKQFIHGLPQLTSLEIIAWPPDISLAPALPHRLRELWLRTRDVPGQSLDEAAIFELAACCPCVETLAITTRRSRGSAAEVALYKALGRFQNLRRLVLTLDASPPPWGRAVPSRERRDRFHGRALDFDTAIDPSFDDLDSQHLSGYLHPYRHGHIRDVFINMAVDETLARAIFSTICAAKASLYGQSAALALDRMVIKPEGGQSFPHHSPSRDAAIGLRTYMATLGLSWLLERDVRDDARHIIHAGEVGWKQRLMEVAMCEAIRGPEYSTYMEYMPIFRRIWPEKPDTSAGWYQDWHSWPLEGTA